MARISRRYPPSGVRRAARCRNWNQPRRVRNDHDGARSCPRVQKRCTWVIRSHAHGQLQSPRPPGAVPNPSEQRLQGSSGVQAQVVQAPHWTQRTLVSLLRGLGPAEVAAADALATAAAATAVSSPPRTRGRRALLRSHRRFDRLKRKQAHAFEPQWRSIDEKCCGRVLKAVRRAVCNSAPCPRSSGADVGSGAADGAARTTGVACAPKRALLSASAVAEP
jgi:hypothetical protein